MRNRIFILFSFLYILLLTFVWQPNVRLLFIHQPHIELLCKFLNDSLWVLPAIVLPLFCARIASNLLHETGGKVFIYIIASMLTVFAVLNLLLYFKLIVIFVGMFLALLLLTKRWQVKWVPFVFLLLMVLFHYRYQLLPKFPQADDADLRVASFNINSRQRQRPELLAEKLALDGNYDVVFFQEFPKSALNYLQENLQSPYPYIAACDECAAYYSTIIFSKIPISSHMNYVFADESIQGFEINHAILDFHGQDINLLNCHITNPVGSVRVNGKKIAVETAHPSTQYSRHQQEGEMLLSFLRQMQGPIILGLDMNDTPNSRLYQRIQLYMQDTFHQRGWGLGTTYGYWIFRELSPAWLQNASFYPVRIDYIFCTPHFQVLHADVLRIKSSEHLPVVTELKIKTRGNNE